MSAPRVACLLFAACTAGSALGPLSLNRTSQDDKPSLDRRTELVDAFDKHRSLSQFQAAVARNSDGDVQGCEALLRQVLAKQPEFHEARLMLADVLTATQRFAEAEEQLRHVIACAPQNAKAHYSLGLLLEVKQQPPESRSELELATRLDPTNTLYRESLRLATREGEAPAEPRANTTNGREVSMSNR